MQMREEALKRAEIFAKGAGFDAETRREAQYNGYKVYGSDGCQIIDEAAAAIKESIQAALDAMEREWRARILGEDVPA